MTNTNAAEKLEFNTNEDFEALLQESFEKGQAEEGSVVEGTVTDVTDDAVTIDVGLKSEGRVALKEFYSLGEKPEINIGDKLEVFIERLENRQGELVLSRERAMREKSWDRLEEEFKNQTQIDGIIFGQVKGGFTVDLDGAIAFLPGSQVDVKPLKDIMEIANQKEKFVILNMDKRRGNIIVSRRAIMEESRAEARDEMLKDIEVGSVLDGTVKNLTNYGAFVDLGGMDGLLHVTDISWKRISHPSEVLKVGEVIKVQVIKYDEESKRVSLGMKQLQENPWENAEFTFKEGDKIKGKVSGIVDYGVFISLDGGLEGFVHNTELSWVKKNQNPSKVVKLEEEVEVQVLEIDNEKQRISLGLKQCGPNPWVDFAGKFKSGDVVKGEIKSISDFGFFLGLEGDIDGLVHYSDLSWDKPGEEALKEYNKGDQVEVKILDIDVEKERVGLGVKQLSADSPVEASGIDLSGYNKNDTVTCVVEDVMKDGIEVAVADTGLKSFIKRGDLSRERSEQRPDRFAVGDRVDTKIVSVNQKTGKFSLSIKALEVDEHKKAIQEFGSSDSGASLGDILGAALEEKKDDK